MFYSQPFLTPAGTPETNPEEHPFYICHGVIHRVEVSFPSGCCGLVHMQVFYHGLPLFPGTPGTSLAADGPPIAWNEYIEVLGEPFRLTVRTWNDDDVYPHTPVLRVGILPKSIAEHIYGKLTKVDRKRIYESFGLPPPGG